MQEMRKYFQHGYFYFQSVYSTTARLSPGRGGPLHLQYFIFVFPQCGGAYECCWVPRSSWPNRRPLASRYWLLSNGMWWTLWTCVFRFPFCEARYGQRWQQKGLSPEGHTTQKGGRDAFRHRRWQTQDALTIQSDIRATNEEARKGKRQNRSLNASKAPNLWSYQR